ncbi:LLM class flavin-dependent oxidoreductase [Streptomyces radicis]|uniref:LLM class flavin-dependent oxidoreductase n=1 Tax=Streptomyces radicis TaxID=1750517 RepID=A0A3A9WQ19_9ACTN|nr:LLM class flavin-dependent oxidoreductase [Streptomyces radicis]RKN11594.1 LLM class flavin-dependent oxidoreductase [Streptomyces radicis]RKN26387.1 LLM class flavin-dependent oxidoreductase [Streptomyces radicis]
MTIERVGVMFDRGQRPEDLAAFATEAEESGLDDLWVVEDLSWAGGVSSAALALAATRRLRVGIGIMPAPLRNPGLLAMEVATLARVFPGRLVAGVGHGVGAWMEGVGAGTPSKLALLGETITALRALLAGETVRVNGRAVRIDELRLVHPPATPPPVVAGVVRPRSLELSGRVADGTVLAEGNGPARVATALTHIAPTRPHELIVFTHLRVSDDPALLAAEVAPVAEETAGFLGVPTADAFLATGDAATAADRVRSLWRAGATTVVLRPIGDDPLGQVRAALAALRPEM